MATSIASTAQRERRRGQFWLRKKSHTFCSTLIVAFPLCWGVMIGLGASWPYWLGSMLITALMALFLVDSHYDEVRATRCATVSKYLPGGQSASMARLKHRLKKRRALIVFVCILGVCWLIQNVGRIVVWSYLLTLGFFIAHFWNAVANVNEPKEVLPPSDEILALASYPATKINAIKMYRKESKLGLKEAKKAIDDALRSSREMERAY